ncbi:MAG: methylmalonyl Co-A mutase-associated GTPase MeaB [Bacteroidota bacterium]|nr:methylmalonyl Co-A mutase-associated GTPase MeaB [Bacteroidota bacterium]
MAEKQNKKSSLKVQKGIAQPSSINPDAASHFRKGKTETISVDQYLEGIISGNRTILSQAITLVESSLQKHHPIAQQIIEKCLPYSGKSLRVGITGVPGVGKSTFIEALGKHLTGKGHKLAVLAIDPSSQRSKGSILGDKTRMEDLANDPGAYIRPSASTGSLGGVARKTRETIILCEAAGFETIFVETVGVGQSETAVHSMVDFFLLLMLAGAGDELQGIKRGIMEMADAIVINKADGDNIKKARLAKQQYENALHLFPPAESGWTPKVLTCSSIQNEGISETWTNILNYRNLTLDNGYFQSRRDRQNIQLMYRTINASLKDIFYHDESMKKMLKSIEKEVLEKKISSFVAAQRLLKAYFDSG